MRGPLRFVSCSGSGRVGLPQFGVLARWNDSMGIPGCNCIVAFAGVVSPIPGDTANLFVWRDLIEKLR